MDLDLPSSGLASPDPPQNCGCAFAREKLDGAGMGTGQRVAFYSPAT